MNAPDRARGLLLMARKDFNAMLGMFGNPWFADEVLGFHAEYKRRQATVSATGLNS